MNATWTGVFPAVTTHLHEDQSLDLAASARRWEILLESAILGIDCWVAGSGIAFPREKKIRKTRHHE